jgi:hypothetical protein
MLKKIKKRWNRISSRGQSLVELAIFFPIIMLMLSGLIEFGFLLNYYLNLMDGPREAARYAVDVSPFEGEAVDNRIHFYYNPSYDDTGCTTDCAPGVAQMVIDAIQPYQLDPATDDIVIKVLAIEDNGTVHSFPSYDPSNGITVGGEFSLNSYLKAKNPSGSYPYIATSKISGTEIATKLISGTKKSGAIVVELFYSYKQQLALPWITMVVPNPIPLHMYAISPLPAATPPDPTPTPIPGP